MLSGFALKNLSLYILTKSVFHYSEGLVQSIERLCRSGSIQIGSKAERFFFIGSLRKRYLTRCQILRSKDYLYTV